MKSIVLSVLILGAFSNAALASEASDLAIKSYLASPHSDKDQVCGTPGKAPTAALVYGGGDTFPVAYTYVVAQEFDCSFFSTSLFAMVTVEMNYDTKNPHGNYVYQVKSIKPITEEMHKIRLGE